MPRRALGGHPRPWKAGRSPPGWGPSLGGTCAHAATGPRAGTRARGKRSTDPGRGPRHRPGALSRSVPPAGGRPSGRRHPPQSAAASRGFCLFNQRRTCAYAGALRCSRMFDSGRADVRLWVCRPLRLWGAFFPGSGLAPPGLFDRWAQARRRFRLCRPSPRRLSLRRPFSRRSSPRRPSRWWLRRSG